MGKSGIALKKLSSHYTVVNKTSGRSPHIVAWYESQLELFESLLGPEAKPD